MFEVSQTVQSQKLNEGKTSKVIYYKGDVTHEALSALIMAASDALRDNDYLTVSSVQITFGE